MDKIILQGGNKLEGVISIAGSKNACLIILAASLLIDEEIKLTSVPNVRDVTYMISLLLDLGSHILFDGLDIDQNADARSIIINNKNISNNNIKYDVMKKMRASVYTLGSMLGRFGEFKISLPGGCAIGTRPIDMHIAALEKLGASIKIEHGYIYAEAKKLIGAKIELPFASVGATYNTIMAAVLAEGETIIINAAREPEVQTLCIFLNTMGAKISGYGSNIITIKGVTTLHGGEFTIPKDRIEIATYAIAAAITDGELLLEDCDLKYLKSVENEFKNIGIDMIDTEFGLLCKKSNRSFNSCNITTGTYPEFSTDIQAQTMVPLAMANGESLVIEKIFENRFMHVAELKRMGADIEIIDHQTVKIKGNTKFSGANVMATDLRASVCLILAGLVAEGRTEVERIYHLDRGYENLYSKLLMCGADIQRIVVKD